MLRALIEDLLQIPGMEVVTTWDLRLPGGLGIDHTTSLEIVSVAGPGEEREVFQRLCLESDTSYVIAPELNDELSRRVTAAVPRHLNCSVESIDLCGDKWALFQHLTRHGIPTIPTYRLAALPDSHSISWPRVLKLRLGAGSQAMQLVSSPADWEAAIFEYDNGSRTTEAIVQPFLPGRAVSVGVVIDRCSVIHRLPVADQFIDPQLGFAYSGGRIPSSHWDGSIEELLGRTLSTIPGLYGYVGIDLLIPDQQPDKPLVVEINPRLTTSYAGYRQLCRDNLAALWLSDSAPSAELHWRNGHVEFNSAGECQ